MAFHRSSHQGLITAVATASVCVALLARSVEAEPRICRTSGLASKKEAAPGPDLAESSARAPLVATLVQTHSDERVPLDRDSPSAPRFDALLADRAVGARAPLDPRLLGLLRSIAEAHRAPDGALPTIELVSGFRSPKLNEMLRKKGHHVASHSQHSLGHAVDFRLVVPCVDASVAKAHAPGPGDGCNGGTARALDPRAIVRELRAGGWDGGTGIYTLRDDWFVHADVGPNRTWFEGPQGAETLGMPRYAAR